MESSRIIFRVHAVKRMFSRKISESDVFHVLNTGEVIQTYPDDQPFPSYLIFGWVGSRPLHLVVADNKPLNEKVVITVYEPDKTTWMDDFKRRRK